MEYKKDNNIDEKNIDEKNIDEKNIDEKIIDEKIIDEKIIDDNDDNNKTIKVDKLCGIDSNKCKSIIGIITIMTFFTFLWAIYNFFIRPTDINKPHLLGGTLFKYPFYVPMLDRSGKLVKEDSFDKWALVHIIIYLIAGLFFPSNYLCIIILSISCEIFEYFIGARARLSDIVNNIFGYVVGSFLNRYNPIEINIDDKLLTCSIISFIILTISIILLYINRKINY